MTEETIHRGLEGVTVAETRLSSIDGEAGELVIGGFPLDEVAPYASYEEMVYLLYTDRLPTGDELEAFRGQLRSRRTLSEGTVSVLREAADREVDVIDALRIGAASASLARTEGRGDDPKEDATLLVAQLPTVVATYWRLLNGEELVEPREDLRHAANVLYMLTGEEPSEAEVRGLETYLNTVVDHGLNASTFTARTIVSTESDLVSAVTGAVGALKGPLHGGAPGPVLEMLQDVYESGDTEAYVREKLEAGERIMGFGHRVYEVRDPRASVLGDAAEQFYRSDGDSDFFEAVRKIEDTSVEILEAHRPDQRLKTNVEFYTAVLLNGVGIPRELFSAVFGISRVGGWTAHCLEQLEDNRLVRPRARYVGDIDRTWTPIEDR